MENPIDVLTKFFDMVSKSNGFEDFLLYLTLAILGGTIGYLLKRR